MHYLQDASTVDTRSQSAATLVDELLGEDRQAKTARQIARANTKNSRISFRSSGARVRTVYEPLPPPPGCTSPGVRAYRSVHRQPGEKVKGASAANKCECTASPHVSQRRCDRTFSTRVGGPEGWLIDQDRKLRRLSIRGTTTPSKRSLASPGYYTRTRTLGAVRTRGALLALRSIVTNLEFRCAVRREDELSLSLSLLLSLSFSLSLSPSLSLVIPASPIAESTRRFFAEDERRTQKSSR